MSNWVIIYLIVLFVFGYYWSHWYDNYRIKKMCKKWGSPSEDYCSWVEWEEGGVWDTKCKQVHCFMEGGIEDNHYEHCPYCGKLIYEYIEG